MSKDNKKIEYDLLKLFKIKGQSEILYTISKIANGTFKYDGEFAYMKKIPYCEMIHHIEKVLVLSTNYRGDIHELANFLVVVDNFSNNINKIKRSSLNKININSLKYDYLIFRDRKNKNNKKFEKKILTLMISCSLLFVVAKKIASSMNQNNNKDDYSNEISDDYLNNNVLEDDDILENDVFSLLQDEEKYELTNEEKEQAICKKYNITQDEFDVVNAIVHAEADFGSYDDAYAVINTLYNRITSRTWTAYLREWTGEDVGSNIYRQATYPKQFVVYEEGLYLQFLNAKDDQVYQAVIDMLFTENIKHDYLQFRANYLNITRDYEQYVENGNKYFEQMSENDRIPLPEWSNEVVR